MNHRNRFVLPFHNFVEKGNVYGENNNQPNCGRIKSFQKYNLQGIKSEGRGFGKDGTACTELCKTNGI